MWTISSPDKSLLMTVWQNEEKTLCYSIEQDGEAVMDKSLLGISTSLGIFSSGLTTVGSKKAEIRETYSLPAGKKAVYENNANELCMDFTFNGMPFTLRVRMFDDGAAFRYEIGNKAGQPLLVSNELTEFNFTKDCNAAWLQDWIESYEGLFNRTEWNKTKGRSYGMPCLFCIGDRRRWLLVTEANVYNTDGSYCACHLQGMGERKMAISFAPEQTEPVETKLPFHTPWRVVIITRTLEALTDNTVCFNLNPPSIIEDTSWIKPSRNIWGWWFFDTGAQLYSEQKRYVDFASAMGFESVTVDASWDATWVKDLCDYARERGVSIWIWTTMNDIGTPEKAGQKLALWSSWGIVGLKVDFFINDSQHTMWQYNMIADAMTKYRLMINYHGCVRPGGEGRTYPNMLTFEGIMGLEHYKWSNLPNAEHNCTVPFTRNAVGPMDYTVTGFSNRNRNTTMAHQAALAVVFETGSQHYSESIHHLEAWQGTDFLRRTKAKYDGMKLLSGYPGDHVLMMRYAKDEYYIGCITNPRQIMPIPLDFLPEGEYCAEIYQDDSSGDLIIKELRIVSNRDTLKFSLQQGGGVAIYISDGTHSLRSGISDGYMLAPIAAYDASEVYLSDDCSLVRYENGSTAIRLSGRGMFRISIEEEKRYTLRLTYASDGPCSILICNGAFNIEKRLAYTGGNKIFRTEDVTVTLVHGISTVTVSALNGTIPFLQKLTIIDNAPNEEYIYSIEKSNLIGGAALIPGKTDTEPQRVAGLGQGGELLFPEIMIYEDGFYLLTINYYSGATLPVMIQVNEEIAVESGLLDTSGEATPRWDIPGSKEVRLYIRKGKNSIRFFHNEMPVVHISSISIRLDKKE